MIETNRYLLAILMLSISLFVVTSSMAQGVKGRDGGKLKAKETRERGEKELTVSGVAYSITAWDAHEPRRVTNFSDQKSLVIPALGEGVATVKLALSARRVLSSGRPHADAGSQESIRKVTKSVEKLRWKIEPLNPSATTSSIRIPSGIFTTNKSRGVEAEYGNYINSDIDGIKLDNFLKKGIHRFKLSVGPSENTPDGGEKISSPFTAEILVIDIKFAVTRNDSVATSLIENIDFDEGKKNKVGKFVPDNADVSPKTADGTSYAPKDFLDLTVSVNPNDKEVLDGAKITLKKIRGLGDIRILSLKGDRKFDFVPVPLGQDLTQDYFAFNGRYFDWFPKIEGMKPGNVELELKYKKAEIEIVRTVSLDVQKPKCTRAQAQAAGWPTKTAQHEGGQYVLELCSDECTKYNWSWSFFTTNYSVSATYKVGEHQGIFIIGNEYNFDDRFPASMSKVKWTKGSFKEIVEAPYSSDDSKKQSLPFGDRALCKHKRIEDYSLDIYNHGRTVAKKPIKGKDIPIKQMAEFSIGPQEYWEWSKVGPILNQEGIATQSCIEKITDGFCDSVCGNCSYVLPRIIDPTNKFIREGELDINERIDEQKRDFFLLEGDPAREVGYGGNHKATWMGKGDFSDPFTHCVDKSKYKKLPQQGLTSYLGLPAKVLADGTPGDRVITGLYGHNSNTDAEAEFQQFMACKENPYDAKPDKACEKCGKNREKDGKIVQWPCVDIEDKNRAETSWFRTKELHNVTDDDVDNKDKPLGNAENGPNPMPICSTSGKKVHGM